MKQEWMEANEQNFIAESPAVDLSQVLLYQQGIYRFSINELVRSIIVEIDVDANGNSQGGVFLYPSDGISGTYWRRVKAGTGRVILLPSTKHISAVPFPGSQGIMHIQMVKQAITPSSYSI